jgi:hypothetical protein
MEGVAWSELQAVAQGLGENHPTGFIESKISRHDGIVKWDNPLVNAIFVSRVLQSSQMSHTPTIRLTDELVDWLKETSRRTGIPHRTLHS